MPEGPSATSGHASPALEEVEAGADSSELRFAEALRQQPSAALHAETFRRFSEEIADIFHTRPRLPAAETGGEADEDAESPSARGAALVEDLVDANRTGRLDPEGCDILSRTLACIVARTPNESVVARLRERGAERLARAVEASSYTKERHAENVRIIGNVLALSAVLTTVDTLRQVAQVSPDRWRPFDHRSPGGAEAGPPEPARDPYHPYVPGGFDPAQESDSGPAGAAAGDHGPESGEVPSVEAPDPPEVDISRRPLDGGRASSDRGEGDAPPPGTTGRP